MEILSYSPSRIKYELNGRRVVVYRDSILDIEHMPRLYGTNMSLGQIMKAALKTGILIRKKGFSEDNLDSLLTDLMELPIGNGFCRFYKTKDVCSIFNRIKSNRL